MTVLNCQASAALFKHSAEPQLQSLSSPCFVSLGSQLQGSNLQSRLVPRQRLRFSPVLAKLKQIEGSLLAAAAEGLRFAVVAARFNEVITVPLVNGALQAFNKYGVKEEHVQLIWVPGSFEIPVVAQALAKSGKYDAVVCIGAVIRGATSHYDAVANSAASGIMSASLNSGTPCIFGVLTCDTMEQAIDRAGGKVGNKGAEAAITAIEMASLLKHHV